MDDTRTMAQLLEAPTAGYEDAIVVPEITADNFELKHGLLNLVQNKQFFGHDKEDPHAHIRYFNKITSTMKFPNVPLVELTYDMACEEYSQEVLVSQMLISSGNPNPYYESNRLNASPTITHLGDSVFSFSKKTDLLLAIGMNPTSQEAPPPVVEQFNLEEPIENPDPLAPMDDTRTMAQLLEATHSLDMDSRCTRKPRPPCIQHWDRDSQSFYPPDELNNARDLRQPVQKPAVGYEIAIVVPESPRTTFSLSTVC
ncbi:hypothetical protein Tco_0770399 [Tanacetum coccineum]|uniref:Reverse transcriptase domain-containing protein n=1 Tax=Tanacetum coccineum TaxID=301880 RepID=A0ABQ4ZC63_9ASTR